ncbi:MAG: acetyl-CoA carboxylase carboxyltransferase subunit alpha [Candidatus Marinimicrobia bacterium]|nr:acetyl-CoA carboxylase carboxyltransferase subunit alpha [Candidatus Neomarinimicrobiota bacterium]
MAERILDFEKPIAKLEHKIEEMKELSHSSDIDLTKEIEKLQNKLNSQIEKIHSNLTTWQRVQLARHPRRPYFLDYIKEITSDFIELHGDRHFADDKAIIAGLATIGGEKVVLIGQQKGRNTKENLFRNFGMPNPEGYRKALRIMKLAEKFNKPVITFIDTPGAYPGLGAEERGQAEAIARNLFEMARLRVPMINVVIGEGASGGALGIGVGDIILVLENTWYSVISPEGCASILYRDSSKAPQAAEAMRVTAQSVRDLNIADEVLPEPNGGAHRSPAETAQIVKSAIVKYLKKLKKLPKDELLRQRLEKYSKMGAWEDIAK